MCEVAYKNESWSDVREQNALDTQQNKQHMGSVGSQHKLNANVAINCWSLSKLQRIRSHLVCATTVLHKHQLEGLFSVAIATCLGAHGVK